ncbi:MAG: lytic transglycosylase domain-containing protein [Sterolibacteriaceae bacterium]|uniref:Lytic transglycosylase domain-containing protein n=1 Tax=Candidatus Methylophosphatis roskildensis TaxID=2899263 RepID=A0A9D7DZA8_9PROT|nr:lytic transglycosylase domain-containing protein [Candidatus Methylophosphatis roskildensis]MBK7236773.1 lytic transglycosylase domain-containing protein [Sterolibacteriaceae bacterium]
MVFRTRLLPLSKLGAGAILASALLFSAGVAAEVDAPSVAEESPRIVGLLDQAHASEQSRDFPLAAQRYCAAAREGSAEGMYRLGRLYSVGLGVKRDNAAAASLLATAARLGHRQAQEMLGSLAAPEGYQTDCFSNPELLAPPPAAQPRSAKQYADALAPGKRKLVGLVERIAARHGIDPRLVLAVITAESNFDIAAASPKNAHGLMQLIPETAERFSVADPQHPEQNLRGGIAYLRWLLAYFRGDVQLALAGYNAGERAVDRYRGVPPYAETQAYVKRVLELYPLATHPFQDGLVEPSVTVIERDTRVEARKRRM